MMLFQHTLFNKNMSLFYSVALYILIFSQNIFADVCIYKIKMGQNLFQEGFHRNLSYGIIFISDGQMEELPNHDCLIALDQKLPPGVYVNPDELSELRRTNRLNAIPKNRVNVELPAEQSEETGVYIVSLLSRNNIYPWVPVHARYHEAISEGRMARNEIEQPKLYIRCPNKMLEMCGKPVPPSVTFLCNGNSREKCSWREMPYDMVTGPLIWDVPIGNLDLYYPVACGTLVVIISGAVYLIKTIHDYMMIKRPCVHSMN